MNRDEFLARKARTTEVKLPDDSAVLIRKLSQGDVETMTERYGDKKMLEGLRFVVSRVMCDDDGNRIFTEADIKGAIREMDTDEVQLIATEAFKFSGLKVKLPKNVADEEDDDAEGDAKNG